MNVLTFSDAILSRLPKADLKVGLYAAVSRLAMARSYTLTY